MISSIENVRNSCLIYLGLLFSQSLYCQLSVKSFDENSIQLVSEGGHSVVGVYEVESGGELPEENIVKLTATEYSIQHLRAGSVYGVHNSAGEIRYFSTRSSSSGEMRVYFNNEVNVAYSDGSMATGTSLGILERDLINAIDDAKISIDFCAYNTSRISIVNALRDAYARGVQVRVIADDEQRNTGWDSNPPFPVLMGNPGEDLMHNKFIIIDADDMMTSWVMTGAMNFTNNQMEIDPNHQIWIQDRALAQAYTLEFEEMWGGNGPNPNLSAARFGDQKNDNTPHLFEIGGKMVELYFSPSDNTAFHIGEAIRSSDVDINCALLIFTHFELRDRLIEKYRDGSRVRVIVENVSSSGSIVNDLRAEGIRVEDHPPSPIFHHKYAIIDEGTNSDPIVITGSHNWTFSADNFNDENTLIIHHQSVANIFLQEFRRWWEQLSTSTEQVEKGDMVKVFPNPVHDELHISSDMEIEKLKVIDLAGKTVIELKDCGFECWLSIEFLKKGIYLLLFNESFYKKISKL